MFRRCGPVHEWRIPTGYPDGLARCVSNSIHSVGVRYRSVENVVQRFSGFRGNDAATDGMPRTVGDVRLAWDERMGPADRDAQPTAAAFPRPKGLRECLG